MSARAILPLTSLLLLAGCGTPDEGFVRGQPPDEPEDPGPPLCADADAFEWLLEDVAHEVGLQDFGATNRGAAVADFDGDGRLDLFTANLAAPPRLYMNEGDGQFRQVEGLPTTGGDEAVSTADYDNDGDPDLFVACGGFLRPCVDGLWRNDGPDADGDPVFTDVTQAAGMADVEVASFGGAWADYDNDGWLDLYVATKWTSDVCACMPAEPPTYPGANLLYRNRGDGTFEEVGVAAGVGNESDSHQAAWLDFDNDGDQDLYVPVFAGDNSLYRNNGDGSFSDVTTDLLRGPFTSFGVLAEDFDNDGNTDLLVAAAYPTVPDYREPHGLYLSDGAGGFTQAALDTGLVIDGDDESYYMVMGLQAGDLDGDGWLEVFFGNGSPDRAAPNKLVSVVPDGEGSIAWVDRSSLVDYAPLPPEGAVDFPEHYPFRTHGVVFFDYDGDRDIDLFGGNGGLDNTQVEPNRLFRNSSNCAWNHVRVRARGSAASLDGLGSVVRVSDGPPGDSTWQRYRRITTSSGFNSAHDPTVTVGTGSFPGPYHLTVRWPDGSEQVVEGVQPRSLVVVDQQ